MLYSLTLSYLTILGRKFFTFPTFTKILPFWPHAVIRLFFFQRTFPVLDQMFCSHKLPSKTRIEGKTYSFLILPAVLFCGQSAISHLILYTNCSICFTNSSKVRECAYLQSQFSIYSLLSDAVFILSFSVCCTFPDCFFFFAAGFSVSAFYNRFALIFLLLSRTESDNVCPSNQPLGKEVPFVLPLRKPPWQAIILRIPVWINALCIAFSCDFRYMLSTGSIVTGSTPRIVRPDLISSTVSNRNPVPCSGI